VHGLIRQCVAEYASDLAKKLPILYGGSVNAENIHAFVTQANINGALIGGASLKTDVFVKLILEASK
jgi:triosephosphate isomerase